MRIRQKKAKRVRSTKPSMAWFMAAAAILQFSAAAPESIWAKDPNTEDPFDPKSAGRPDRWGRDRDPNTPYRPDGRWHPSEPLGDRPPLNIKHWLITQLTDKEKPIAFNIPPQPLSSALLLFSELSSVQLAYTTEDIQGVDTAGVSGMHAVDEALTLLLTNTGIQYRVTGPSTITLEKHGVSVAPAAGMVAGVAIAQDQSSEKLTEESPPTKPVKVPEVVVKDTKQRMPVVDLPDGYKADVSSEAVLRFPASIQELPMSVSVVTQDSMRERRAITQQEALEGVAGIVKTTQFSGQATDNYVIRGFDPSTPSPGYSRDNGLAAFNNYVADPTLYERIEVIKGPASFTSGLVDAGGFVNRLLKAPLAQNFVVAQAGAGSYGHYRTTLDANGVMPNLPVAGRFVFTQNDDAEFFRNSGSQRFSFLPSIRFTPREDFTVTITGNVQQLRGKGNFGTPVTTQGLIPAGIEDSFLGNDNSLKLDYHSIHAEAEKKFVQGFRLKAKGQYSHDKTSYRYSYGFQSGGIGPDGNFGIYAFGMNFKRESWAGEVNLTKDFSLFGNMSSVAVGMDYSMGRWLVQGRNSETLGTGNVGSPDNNLPFPPGFPEQTTSLVQTLRFNQTGAFLQGLLRPFAGTTLMAALRGNWISEKNETPTVVGELNVSRLTPHIGVSQQLIEGLNVYASYGESIQPNLALNVDGSVLTPRTGKTLEVGSKWEPLGKRVRLTAALFRTDLDNVATPDSAAPPGFSIGGQNQRNQGFEFEARGRLVPNLQVSLAYTLLETEITKSTRPGFVGLRAFNAPTHTLSAFGSYDLSDILMKGLKLGAVVYYRSEVNAFPFFQNNTYESNTRADLFAIYAPLKWLSFQVNVNNIADAHYVESPNRYGGFNHFGAPRHVIGMVRMTF